MTDRWDHALDNYTLNQNKAIDDFKGNDWDNGICIDEPKYAANLCNERGANCKAIVKIRHNNNNPTCWQLISGTTSSVPTLKSDNWASVYMKNSQPAKPSELQTGIGMLPDGGDTKVKVCRDEAATQSCTLLGRGAYLDKPPANQDWGSINSIAVPLGYKVGNADIAHMDRIDWNWSRDNGDKIGAGGNYTYSSSPGGLIYSGASGVIWPGTGWAPSMKPSTFLIQQTPIDMDAEFSNLINKGVGAADAASLKTDYCAQASKIDTSQCRTFLGTAGTAGTSATGGAAGTAGTSYNSAKLLTCMDNPSWGTDATCVHTVNEVLRTTGSADSGDRATAAAMVRSYCPPYSTKPECACPNAISAGTVANCVAHPNIPGCDTISNKVGQYNSMGGQFLGATLKPFCACDQCKQAQSGTDDTMIGQPGESCTDSINACFSQVTVGEMTGGTIDASCNITAGTPGTGGSGGSGGSGGKDELLTDNKTVAKYLDTREKQEGGIGGVVLFCVCCCFCIVILLLAGGDSDGGGKGFDPSIFLKMQLAGLRGA